MIDTVKFKFYMTDLLYFRLNDQNALSENSTTLYGSHFFLKHPFGLTNPAVRFSFEKRAMEIEASLPKLLQGHNVFGSDRLEILCLHVVALIYGQLGMSFGQSERRFIQSHRIKIGRIDITCSFRLNSPEEVRAAIEEIVTQFRAEGRDWAAYGRDDYQTAYNQKGSKRRSDKFYSKHDELLIQKIPLHVGERKRIIKSARKLLRYEQTIRARELCRLNLDYADQWTVELVHQMLMHRIDKFELQGSIKQGIVAAPIKKLNKCSQTFYKLWEQGANLRIVRNYAPLRRARDALRRQGVDIFRPCGSGNEVALYELLTKDNAYFFGPKGLSQRGAIFGGKVGKRLNGGDPAPM